MGLSRNGLKIDGFFEEKDYKTWMIGGYPQFRQPANRATPSHHPYFNIRIFQEIETILAIGVASF